jgi:hypothetical protein
MASSSAGRPRRGGRVGLLAGAREGKAVGVGAEESRGARLPCVAWLMRLYSLC